MVKKIVMGSLALTVVGGLIFGRDALSYVRTGCKSVQENVRSNVPIEFEIQRARQEVAQLLPEIRKSVTLIAQQQVEVDRLAKSIEKREAALAEQEEAILSLSADLKSGDTQFVYAGHKYSQSEVEKDLADRFSRFQIAEDTVKREHELLVSKETALKTHRETLESMLSQRKGLEVELERLEARLRTVEARKQISTLAIDDSQLARVKDLISTIDERLDVEDAVLATEGNFSGLIPVEEQKTEEETKDIASKVDSYFHGRNAEDQIVSSGK